VVSGAANKQHKLQIDPFTGVDPRAKPDDVRIGRQIGDQIVQQKVMLWTYIRSMKLKHIIQKGANLHQSRR
jgi:hypothetical protein